MIDLPLTSFFDAGVSLAVRNGAYEALQTMGREDSQVRIVFEYINAHPEGVSLWDIEHDLHLRQSSVCGRVSTLRKNFLIVANGVRINTKTGMPNMIWIVNKEYPTF